MDPLTNPFRPGAGTRPPALLGRDELIDHFGVMVRRAIAEKAGNSIVLLDAAETQRWRRTAAAVESEWVADVKGKGIDGAKLAADARALMSKYAK